MMKVILKQDVKNLGKAGDVVEVAEGYGRNYLIPRELALPASGGNISQLEEKKKAEKNRYQRELKQAQAKGQRLEGCLVEVKVKAGEKGKLYGAITSKDISQAIKTSLGEDVDKRNIDLEGPIKSLGEYQVRAKLHPEVTVELTVRVTAEGE